MLFLLFVPITVSARTLCVPLAQSGEKPNPREFPTVSITLDKQTRSVKVSVRNDSKHDVSFLDTINFPQDAPEYFGIAVRDKAGIDVSGGLNSPKLLALQNWATASGRPPEPAALTTLHPGEEISRTIKIAALIVGMQQFWKVPPEKLDEFSIRFGLFLYPGFDERQYERCETDWIYLKDNKLLVAPQEPVTIRTLSPRPQSQSSP